MKRRLEPELMDDAAQALAYAEADFSESNALFMRLLAKLNPGTLAGAEALDLGCGPADISIRFLKTYPQARCTALDGAPAMIELAQTALARLPGVATRCELRCERLPSAQLPSSHFDVILSNSLLHHLPDPQVLWQTIQQVAKPGALVVVMDLMRPASAGWAEALVATYAEGMPEVLRCDFRNSLFAAFEPAEVVAQLAAAGLTTLEVGVVSDRHFAVTGRLPA
ncbi:SAM-dependent methyltransferase [Chromatium weissei]|nr:SAM-dependent methyltransferase [Chromatium weissei]